MKNLYIVGAGGLGRQIAWITERINENSNEWNIVGFLDDDSSLAGKTLNGLPVVGTIESIGSFSEEAWLVTAFGSVKTRKAIVDRIASYKNPNVHYATLVDPSVQISKWVEIGEDTVICAGSIVTVNIKIGSHVLVNWDCTIGHDSVIEDYVTLSPSVNICGNVHIGSSCDIGVGAQVIQQKRIASGTVVGGGAVVVRDIDVPGTYVGVPASLKIVRGGVNSCNASNSPCKEEIAA